VRLERFRGTGSQFQNEPLRTYIYAVALSKSVTRSVNLLGTLSRNKLNKRGIKIQKMPAYNIIRQNMKPTFYFRINHL
jgi:hypothetical protein